MRHDRASALNRFETELAQAIDAQSARSATRRHVRLAALGVVVALALAAGVGYAWSRRDTSSRLATTSPGDATTITGPSDGSGLVVLERGHWNGNAWELQLQQDGGDQLCVRLVRTTGLDGEASTCGEYDALEANLGAATVDVLQLPGTAVWGGLARADVARVDLVDPLDRVIATAATEPDARVPGGRYWAVGDAAGSTAVVAYDANGGVLGRRPQPNPALASADPARVAEATDIEHAAAAAIVGLGTVDPDEFIDDPDGLAQTRDALAAAHPEQVGHTRFVLTRLTFTGENSAEFVYDILLAPPLEGRPLRGLVGHAVRVDGVWKITRATACQAWNWGGGIC